MEEEILLTDDAKQKEINKEKRSYYAKYIFKFALCIFPAMYIYAILSNSLVYFNKIGWIPSWLTSILVYGILMLILYLFITLLPSFFDKDRIAESKEIYGFEGQKRKLGFGWFVVILLVSFFLARIMTAIGLLVTGISYIPPIFVKIIMVLRNGGNFNYPELVQNLINGNSILTTKLSMSLSFMEAVVLAPIFEELLFRKILMDRVSKYGVSGAIIVSGLFFGLYHMYTAQFFMATTIGILLAYVYSYTHNVKYTILLHSLYNLFGAGLAIFNMLFVSNDYSVEYNAALTNFLEKSAYTEDIVGLCEDLLSDIGRVLMNHPISALFTVLDKVRGLAEVLMFLAGLVLFFVFMKRFFKMRKTLHLSDKGTKRCAVFNWASILYIVAGIVGAMGLYIVIIGGVLIM